MPLTGQPLDHIRRKNENWFDDRFGSKEGMQSSAWGPHMWTFMHCTAQNYCPDQPGMREGYMRFFDSLQYVLPCKKCRVNYVEKWQAAILHEKLNAQSDRCIFASRKNLCSWVVGLHNEVNVATGKRVWTLDEASERYEKFRAK